VNLNVYALSSAELTELGVDYFFVVAAPRFELMLVWGDPEKNFLVEIEDHVCLFVEHSWCSWIEFLEAVEHSWCSWIEFLEAAAFPQISLLFGRLAYFENEDQIVVVGDAGDKDRTDLEEVGDSAYVQALRLGVACGVVEERPSDFVEERPSDFVEERPSDFVGERLSDFVEERPSDFVEGSYFFAGVGIAYFLFAEAYLDVEVFPVPALLVYLLFWWAWHS